MPRLTNQQTAKLFADIGDLLEIKGENRFKVLAYRNAADHIENLSFDLYDYWESGGDLRKIEGIGQAISEKIDEKFKTGKLGFWDKLAAEIPPALVEVLAIPDVGPKMAKAMWEELGLTTLAEVKAAAQEGKLQKLPRMGAKSEARILASIEAVERRETGRVHLGVAWPLAMRVLAALKDLPQVIQIEPAGSLRRMRETVGDLDFVTSTEQPQPIMAVFKTLPEVEEVIAAGETKTSVRFRNGMQADLRCVSPSQWGPALNYFTGNKNHNVKIRELAQKKGYSLNEYALTRTSDGEPLFFADEVELYKFFGLPYIPPYLREDRGEIEAAFQGKLPAGLEVGDIKGEVHCHSTWSDGQHSIEEMARAALAKGYQYLAITDHSQSLGVAGGLNADRLAQQRREIDEVQTRVPNIRLWQGSEVEVRADGTLDFPDEVLAQLDYVVASVHTGLRQDRDTLTRRALAAIRNPYVKQLAHPTGRLLPRREGGDFDMEALIQAAAETGAFLEINAAPERLDLPDTYVRRAIELGVKLIINCDAHHVEDFNNLRFGVATACRGWASAENVVNTRPLDEFVAAWKKA
ncbi:MAG: DNA polymerase/3'-5' exonuclease PolX [Anaerolineae bacterium]|nr:DNA polymerase/3'-5' exonuclease PolX [Anaerolineales bacterium]MCQ3973080.1 DNA polymerase/3'-5' exonuclease PolX [Anaerolineae bacterium]